MVGLETFRYRPSLVLRLERVLVSLLTLIGSDKVLARVGLVFVNSSSLLLHSRVEGSTLPFVLH